MEDQEADDGAANAVISDIVFPGQLNHHGTFFGGAGLSLMTRAAFVAASRAARCDIVMAGCERAELRCPVRTGELVEAYARVRQVRGRALTVEVEVTAEDLLTGERRKALSGTFQMVTVGGREFAAARDEVQGTEAGAERSWLDDDA